MVINMSIVSYKDKESLEGEALAIYDKAMAKSGRVTNMVRTLLHSVPAFQALEFYPVRDELLKKIGSRAVYFYCYAISSENECLICTTYHAKLLEEFNLKPEEFSFTEIEKVLIDYGRALVKRPNHIEQEIYDRLGELFTEEEIVLITAVGCKMIASNLFNSAMKVDLDEYLYQVKFDKNILGKR